MKKFASLFIAGALSLSLLAVGASADGEVIKKGTATIDGNLDPAYTGSLVLTIGPESNEWTSGNWDGTASATTYYMYDDENLYLFADVVDNEVLSAGEAAATDPTGVLNETNDVFMWRLSLDGTENVIKIGVDAFAYNLFGLPAHYDVINYDEMIYEAVITDDGYHVEVSCPCSKGMTDMISAGKLGIAMELSDLMDDGTKSNICWATPGQAYNIPVFYDLSDEAAVAGATDTPATDVPATDVPATDVPATDVPATDVPATDAPTTGADTPATTDKPTTSTFDPMLATLAVTAASGAAYIVISKSKKH